jgi:hypothetical protein
MGVPRRARARATPWAVVLIPLVDLLLVVTGVLTFATAVVVAVVLEALLAVVVMAEWVAFRRAWRAARARGDRRSEALLAGLEATAPRPLVLLVRSEMGMWQSLWWAVCRRRARPAGCRRSSAVRSGRGRSRTRSAPSRPGGPR